MSKLTEISRTTAVSHLQQCDTVFVARLDRDGKVVNTYKFGDMTELKMYEEDGTKDVWGQDKYYIETEEK